MKNNTWLILIIGIVLGVILMYVVKMNSKTKEEKELETYLELVKQIQNQKSDIQYFEVKGKKGLVLIHTELSKDSAKILLGKPTKTEMDNYLGNVSESWNYDLNHDENTHLTLNFRNGVLYDYTEY